MSIFRRLQVGEFLFRSAMDSITAHAGGGQTSAYDLGTNELNRISTVATAADSVKLPPAQPGLTITVLNHGANPAQVFGQSGDTINDIATATGVPQSANTAVLYMCFTAGAWYTLGLGSAGSYAANGLVTRQEPLGNVRNSDLTVIDATGSSTKLKLLGTVGTSLGLATAAVQNTTNTCLSEFEYVLPSSYVAGQNITLTANCKRNVSAGTTMTTSLAVNAYLLDNTGAAGSDICATSGAQAFTSTTGVDVPFTITGTTLTPGAKLQFKLTTVATEGGNSGTVQSQINSIRIG